MIIKDIALREDDPSIVLRTYVSELRNSDPYISKLDTPPRDAVLVIPGGGYSGICADREGELISLAYSCAGLNAFVLYYSVGKKAVFPRPLCDASLAVSYIRTHAQEFNINPERIFVVGFSAGGHLAASLGTMWDMPEIYETTGITYGSNRPNGMILGYPVISGKRYASHGGSFHAILGKSDPSDEELELYSIENHVNPETAAPLFVFHTSNDPAVPVSGSLLLAHEYAKKGMKFELHVFPDGPHGLALANKATSLGNPDQERPEVEQWIPLSLRWMNSI